MSLNIISVSLMQHNVEVLQNFLLNLTNMPIPVNIAIPNKNYFLQRISKLILNFSSLSFSSGVFIADVIGLEMYQL